MNYYVYMRAYRTFTVPKCSVSRNRTYGAHASGTSRLFPWNRTVAVANCEQF